ncbi:MAG: molybdopterin-dependent oxidoreductase [Ilumatobacteraceae bacterium]
MQSPTVSRRALLRGGSAALAGLSVWQVSGPAEAFPGHGGDDDGEDVPWSDQPSAEYPGNPTDEVLAWLDQPAPIPPPAANIAGNLLVWEALNSRLIPNAQFMTIKHYNLPLIDPTTYQLTVDGLVDHPATLSLDDIKARPRREVEFTLECSGNTGLPFLIGAIGNARWAGARLRPILREVAVQDAGTEVVFWGEDQGTVTIRDNSGVTGGGDTGTFPTDAAGGLTITERFARSMSLDEAMASPNLLCYEMNNEALPPEHGAPLRLIAPGWYGVANVKWLKRIEVMDHRFAGRFMARDYVTFRERTFAGDTLWTFTTVGHALLKSAPAKVTRHDGKYTIIGVAWGAPIRKVEVSIDGGPWVKAKLGGSAQTKKSKGYAWRFWTYDWDSPSAGEHTVASRAIDVHGNVQPAPDDPSIATKHTFWESNGQITRHVVIA